MVGPRHDRGLLELLTRAFRTVEWEARGSMLGNEGRILQTILCLAGSLPCVDL